MAGVNFVWKRLGNVFGVGVHQGYITRGQTVGGQHLLDEQFAIGAQMHTDAFASQVSHALDIVVGDHLIGALGAVGHHDGLRVPLVDQEQQVADDHFTPIQFASSIVGVRRRVGVVYNNLY